jgi:NAD(P)-dependent dehydrogenase (short-subunit alcohol dehydrogenase family)
MLATRPALFKRDKKHAMTGVAECRVGRSGVQTETAVDEATREDWAFVVETDFRAYWLTAKHAVDHMPPGSNIVNVSSNHAHLPMLACFRTTPSRPVSTG